MEQQPGPEPVEDKAERSPLDRLAELPAELGFVATPELAAIDARLVEAMRGPDAAAATELLAERQQLAERIVEQLPGDTYAAAQVGMIIATGILRREGGRVNGFVDDLRDASAYAWNLGLDEVVGDLDAAVEATLATHPELDA